MAAAGFSIRRIDGAPHLLGEIRYRDVNMASSVHPQLSHCGVDARDVSKMVDLYTNVAGLVVSDRASAAAAASRR